MTKRVVGVLFLLGAAAIAASLLRTKGVAVSEAEPDSQTGKRDAFERTNSGHLPIATGREDSHDVLGSGHALSASEAQQVRAAQRTLKGKNTNAARESMYVDLSGTGTSGTQGSTQGREDNNPIGPK